MKAITYYGEGDIRFEERPKPTIQEPTDAIVKIEKTTICGTDLGIFHGKNPEIEATARERTGEWNGRILGHEGIGVVEEVGSSVTGVKPGDRVIISCVSRCGACQNCQRQLYSHCQGGGSWILGYMIDGTQAEYVRTPFADTSLFKLPEELDTDAAVFLSDALPTGHEIGVLSAQVKPGDDVAIVGAGPVGMGALITAQLYSPASITVIDMNASRLEKALAIGATSVINPAEEDVQERIMEITEGRGVDIVVDPVGGDRFTDSLRSLGVEGRMLVLGFTGGSIPEVKVNRLLLNNIDVVGVGWGAFWMPRPETVPEQWKAIEPLVASGALKPVLGPVRPLEKAGEAIAEMEERRAEGKLVLTL